AEFSGTDELGGDGERVEEAGTGRLHVEAANVADPDHVADDVGGRRKDHVGVVVAQIRRSTSFGCVTVRASSPRTASAAMCEVPSPSPLRMRRCLMPVRSVIQASLVSTMRASSALSRM